MPNEEDVIPLDKLARVYRKIYSKVQELTKDYESQIEELKAKQDETNIDLARIKDPDSGLFSRIKTLENWKEGHSKITWGAISAVTFLIVKQLWDVIT